MRTQLNVPPDARARQQMLAKLHAQKKTTPPKPPAQDARENKDSS